VWRLLRTIIFLGVAGLLAYHAYRFVARERQVTARLNEAAASMTAGDFELAIQQYSEVMRALDDRRDAERMQAVRHNLARCHVRLAEDPSQPLAVSLRHYRRARELDAGSVTDPHLLRLLDKL